MLDWDESEIALPAGLKETPETKKLWDRFNQLNASAGTEEAFAYLKSVLNDDNFPEPQRTLFLETIEMQWAIDGNHLPPPIKTIM